MKRTVIAGPAVAALTVAAWAGWVSWEDGYHTDVATGATSGPYAWWQVAGCVLSLLVIAAVAPRWLNPLVVVPVMAACFTIPWAISAATSDDSGLWAAGAFLVLIGMVVGAGVVSTVSWLILRRRR